MFEGYQRESAQHSGYARVHEKASKWANCSDRRLQKCYIIWNIILYRHCLNTKTLHCLLARKFLLSDRLQIFSDGSPENLLNHSDTGNSLMRKLCGITVFYSLLVLFRTFALDFGLALNYCYNLVIIFNMQ